MVDMSTVWDRTTAFAGDNAGKLALIALPTIFVAAATQDVLAPVAASPDQGMRAQASLAGFALSLLSLFGQLSVTALSIDPAAGTGGALGRVRKRFLPALVVLIVVALGAMFALVPLVAMLAAAGVAANAMGQMDNVTLAAALAASPGLALAASLYALAFLLVLAWLVARLAVTGPVVLAEGVMLAALRRSYRLTRRNGWRIIGVMLLFALLTVVAGTATRLVVGSVSRLVLDGDGLLAPARLLTIGAVALVGTIASVFVAGFVGKLYLALRSPWEETR